jgi:acetyl esterase
MMAGQQAGRRTAAFGIVLGLALVCWRTWAEPPRHQEPFKPKPDFANLRYGPHDRNVLDLWKARPRAGTTAGPTPVVVFFHGGGFRLGDKSSVPGWLLANCRDAGISVASANCRLSTTDTFPAPMHDGARAIQYLRSRSKELGLDPDSMAASGSSAGAGIALWIGFHDDLADPQSPDPISRQSTRLTCIGVDGAQTSYDPRFIQRIIGGRAHEHPALASFYGLSESERDTPRARKLYESASPINYATTGDPPVFLFYLEPDVPLPADAKPGQGIHHPRFGAALQAKLAPSGVECIVRHAKDFPEPEDPNPAMFREMATFFERHLSAPLGR